MSCQGQSNIRLHEIVSFKEQWMTGRIRERIRETITDIQPGRVPAFAVGAKGTDRERGLFWCDTSCHNR